MTLPTLPITLTRARRPTRTTASPPSSERNAGGTEPVDRTPGAEDQLPHPTDEVPREVHGEPRALHQPEAKLTTEHGGEYQEQDHTQPPTADFTHPPEETNAPDATRETQSTPPGPSDLHDFATTEGVSEEREATPEVEVESIPGSVDNTSEGLPSEVDEVVAPPTAHEPVTTEHHDGVSRELSESTTESFATHEGQLSQEHHEEAPLESEPGSPTSAAIAEHAAAHKPDYPRHAPGLSHTTAATSPTLGRGHDDSEPEDLSPMSSPDEEPLDEYEYLQGSEASGPAPPHPPLDGVSTPSGYVSDDVDVQDAVFNHSGEAYIDEGEVSGIDQLRPSVQDEDSGEEGTEEASEVDQHESPPELAQVPMAEGHEQPSDVLAKEEDESQEAAEYEDELAMVSEVPNESTSFEQQDKYGDIGSEIAQPHGQVEPALSLHGAAEFEPAIPHEADMAAPASPHDVETPSPPNDDLASEVLEDYGDEEESEPRPEEEEHPPERAISPNHYREYAASPELPQGVQPDSPHEPPGHGSFHEADHEVSHVEAENDYDTDNDNESQRFVTPLPSHQSLRSFSEQQQANLAQEVGPEDHIGSQYRSYEDSQQVGQEDQHAAGEESHVEDHGEHHGHLEDSTAHYSNTSQEGTPVLRSALEPAEASIAPQRIPDLNIEPPTSPETFSSRKSWVEEIGQYFDNEDELESRVDTHPPGYGAEASNTHPDHLRQESSVTAVPTSGSDNLERPETPAGNESLVSPEYVTPETLAARDTTNRSWGANDGWTPQSLRTTQSVLTSPPTSPPHPASATKPEADLSSSLPTGSSTHHGQPQQPDPFTHEPETRRPLSLKTPWHHPAPLPSDEPPEPKPEENNRHSEGHSGSLFKRMRSIFEQPRPSGPPTNTSSNRESYPGSSARSPPSTGAWFTHPADVAASAPSTRVTSFSTPSPVHSLRGGDAEVGSLRFPPRSPTGGSGN